VCSSDLRERYDSGTFGAWALDGMPYYPRTSPASPTTNSSFGFRDGPGWDPYGSMAGHAFRHEFETCVACVTTKNKITCLLSCFTWSYDYTVNTAPPPDHSLALTISGNTTNGLPKAGNPNNTPTMQVRPTGGRPTNSAVWNTLLKPYRFE